MSGLIPMAMFGLEVPPGDIAVPAGLDIPAAFRITMAAIDPSEEAEEGEAPRATLKVIRQPLAFDDDEDDADEESVDSDDDFDTDLMDRILAGEDDDEDDSDDEEVNGGPSDPAKSKKAQLIAKIKELQAEEEMDMDEDADDLPNGVNGLSAKAKGKLPAGSDEDLDDEDDEDEDDDIEEFVICTLDPSKSFQQTLDITFGEREMVYFKVSGAYSVHLTGNYVEPQEDRSRLYDPEDDSDEDYDLEPDSDELDMDEDEEDELDDLDDPRITEVDEDEEVPALVKATKSAKDSKKRSAPEDDSTLDDMMTAQKAAVNGEPKLSKKQMKKLKKNDGSAVAVEKEEAPASNKSDKKVQFAKELEQGPTPTKDGKAKASLGPKTIQGVTIDDKKLGKGPAAKNGDRVGMRYIGKLESNNAVFDSNKKGKPFSFKLGSGEVIKGWDVGIAGMSIGGERRITVPAHMAYGSKGAPPSIPGNATLVFDVKLIDLNKGK